MFSHLSVSHSVHRGVCVAGGVRGGEHAWWGHIYMHGRGVCVRGCAWQRVCMAGACMTGGVCAW